MGGGEDRFTQKLLDANRKKKKESGNWPTFKFKTLTRCATCQMNIEYPIYLSNKRCLKLLDGLLRRAREKRFDITKIKKSRFFTAHFDWDQLANQVLEPPFVPSQDSVQADDQDKIEEKRAAVNATGDGSGGTGGQEQWESWDFVGGAAFQGEMLVNLYSTVIVCIFTSHKQTTRSTTSNKL